MALAAPSLQLHDLEEDLCIHAAMVEMRIWSPQLHSWFPCAVFCKMHRIRHLYHSLLPASALHNMQ